MHLPLLLEYNMTDTQYFQHRNSVTHLPLLLEYNVSDVTWNAHKLSFCVNVIWNHLVCHTIITIIMAVTKHTSRSTSKNDSVLGKPTIPTNEKRAKEAKSKGSKQASKQKSEKNEGSLGPPVPPVPPVQSGSRKGKKKKKKKKKSKLFYCVRHVVLNCFYSVTVTLYYHYL